MRTVPAAPRSVNGSSVRSIGGSSRAPTARLAPVATPALGWARGTWFSDRRKGPPTTELFFGAGMPGLAPPAGPAFAPAPPAPVPPRVAPARSVPPLDALVEVPAGTYRLGEPGEERDVAVGPVLIGRWPVVNARVRAFVEATGHPVAPALAARLDAPQLADHPATEVSFDDVLAFCAWAG